MAIETVQVVKTWPVRVRRTSQLGRSCTVVVLYGHGRLAVVKGEREVEFLFDGVRLEKDWCLRDALKLARDYLINLNGD